MWQNQLSGCNNYDAKVESTATVLKRLTLHFPPDRRCVGKNHLVKVGKIYLFLQIGAFMNRGCIIGQVLTSPDLQISISVGT